MCVEDCTESETSAPSPTCEVRLELSRCTCGGVHVALNEVRKFDMDKDVAVFLGAPSSSKLGPLYLTPVQMS